MKSASDIHTHVLLKVADDAEFGERLIDDPKGVIEAEIGRELPEDALVLIKQMVANSLEGMSDNRPLSKEEMAQVVGGGQELTPSQKQALEDHCEENPQDWTIC